MNTPAVVIESDYDGFFGNLVANWIAEKELFNKQFKSERIIISAGPYRSNAVTTKFNKKTKTLHIDFYSALRTGYGELSDFEIETIINDWL